MVDSDDSNSFISQRHSKGWRFSIPKFKKGRCPLSHKTNSNRYLSYIDNYHVEVGTSSCNLFHICEFAERMEASCAMVELAGAVIEHNQESREKDRSDAR